MAGPPAEKSQERLAALFAYLASQDVPVNREEILEDLDAYYCRPEDHGGAGDHRVKTPNRTDGLLRDLDQLTQLGATVEWLPEHSERPRANPHREARKHEGKPFTWRLRPHTFLRRELGEHPEHTALLATALSLFAPSSSDLVRGLGGKLHLPEALPADSPDVLPISADEWRTIVEAHDDRRFVQFTVESHTQGARTLIGEPWALVEARDVFYLVVRERDHETARAIRLTAITPGSVDLGRLRRKANGDECNDPSTWQPKLGEVKTIHDELLSQQTYAALAADGTERSIRTTHGDAAVGQAIRDGLVLVDPALRRTQAQRLRAVIDAAPPAPLAPRATDGTAPPAPGRTTRPTSRTEMSGALELVLLLTDHDGPVPVADVAARSGRTEEDVLKLLTPWAAASRSLDDEAFPGDERGLVDIDPGPPATAVAIRPRWLADRTLYLRRDEAAALRVGLDYIRETGNPARAQAVSELLAALDLPDAGRETPANFVHLDHTDQPHLPEVLSDLDDAVGRVWCRIHSSRWVEPREVAPLRVARAAGTAIVCLRDDEGETYWVETDRITAVELLARAQSPADAAEVPPPSHRGGGLQLTVELGPDAVWAVDAYGATVMEEQPAEGALRVTKDVAGVAAGARMALRLAGVARVVEPPEVVAEAQRRARALLERVEER
ncbi:WYL domain-containing protein [Kytococcus sp. HMSC28H12]|uniref:WYL domain-containing protein n=1 Tax=Kytococcus sp. HMSC28H12 TaxID=1581067 RepID=UPI0008A343DC|nr:WYL domain-containing protein [Kytococcus sp. HMSC28H12]OFS06173.1 hypothetical protein HMPREF3099_11415 [Kytococcus sp. HMSC28H12]